MKRTDCLFLALPLLLTGSAASQVVAYTDEATFLGALAGMGTPVVQEGFEDDAAWGGVRSTVVGGPVTAPSVTSQGLTWVSSSTNNEITTGPGAALSGQWGLYSLPHGDYLNNIGDGFGAAASQPLVAVGAWIRTNTPPAKIGLELDGLAVDFGGQTALGVGGHQFFGAIDPAGFSHFMFLELEGALLDQKFVFMDDASFAFGGSIVDCNQNGLSDAFELASGTSADCNNNAIPDECEIDAGSGAPGGPFYCSTGCAADCNDNGVPDACEVVAPLVSSSGQLGPIGNGSPQSFTLSAPPPTLANVVLDVTAAAKLDGTEGYVDVFVNGVAVGSVFDLLGTDCPEIDPDSDRLVIPAAVFNAAVGGGDALNELVAADEVDPFDCNAPTWIALDVTLWGPSAEDANQNGVPDECEVAAVSYCTAGTSASGCQALLSASGQASASAPSGLCVDAQGVEGAKNGIVFFGANGRQASPWGNGSSYQCVTPPVTRAGLLAGTGTPGSCDGAYLQDLNALWCPTCPGASKNPGAGAVVQAQLWYRDPQNTSNQSTSLSDAVEFTVSP